MRPQELTYPYTRNNQGKLQGKEISRGVAFIDKIGQETGEVKGVAVSLQSHHENVMKLCRLLFFRGINDDTLRDSLYSATLRHDKYKPATISLIQTSLNSNKLTTSFLGHPYMLSFSDFEQVEEDREKIGYAFGIGRLHHMLNVRDVERFVETVAYIKHYVSKHGIGVSVAMIRRKVLLGVLLLHICDNISAFAEQYLIEQLIGSQKTIRENYAYDTSSDERIYPHLPLTIIPEENTMNIYFFSLKNYYKPEKSEETYTYNVYLGVFKIKRAATSRGLVRYKVIDFEVQEKKVFSLNFRFFHKSSLIQTLLKEQWGRR